MRRSRGEHNQYIHGLAVERALSSRRKLRGGRIAGDAEDTIDFNRINAISDPKEREIAFDTRMKILQADAAKAEIARNAVPVVQYRGADEIEKDRLNAYNASPEGKAALAKANADAPRIAQIQQNSFNEAIDFSGKKIKEQLANEHAAKLADKKAQDDEWIANKKAQDLDLATNKDYLAAPPDIQSKIRMFLDNGIAKTVDAAIEIINRQMEAIDNMETNKRFLAAGPVTKQEIADILADNNTGVYQDMSVTQAFQLVDKKRALAAAKAAAAEAERVSHLDPIAEGFKNFIRTIPVIGPIVREAEHPGSVSVNEWVRTGLSVIPGVAGNPLITKAMEEAEHPGSVTPLDWAATAASLIPGEGAVAAPAGRIASAALRIARAAKTALSTADNMGGTNQFLSPI